jgi:hypothetical protein
MPVKVVQRFERMIQTSATKAEPRQGQPSPPPPPADAETIKWLYDVLTILDSKAGALLAFDGLLLAAEALMHEKMLEKMDWLHPYSLALILFTLVTALLCLFVAQVSYDFLGNIDLDKHDNTVEIDGLGKVVELRTTRLGLAWGFSVIAVICFIILVFFVLVKG